MARDRAIAVVGLGVRFPGAPDLPGFWRLVEIGESAITEVPEGRWESRFFDPGEGSVDRIYCRRGGFLGESVEVDTLRFGIMPVAAAGAEPDQLLSLEVAVETLEDAGLEEGRVPRERTAVILGRGGYLTPGLVRANQTVRGAEQLAAVLRTLLPDLDEVRLEEIKEAFQAHSGAYGPDTAIGLVPNLTASRIASRLDLQGPAYTVDAACASALLAVDHARRELESGRCDLVLAGGVHLVHDVTFWSVFAQLGALSRSGNIRPFDRRADGLLIGEGVGLLLLERLEDAERAGRRIYAVLRGTGVASDGRAASLMAPRVEGQLLAVRRAWEDAGLDPETLGLLEGHGTGTPAGDAAELATLAAAFGPASDGRRGVLGSVKANIGHAMPAAGAAGLIKAVLAVHHGVLPPSPGCEEPSAALADTRFEVLAAARPWESSHRVAGVNAFGFGGIDAHVVVESHGAAVGRVRRRTADGDERLVTLAAADPRALLEALDTGRLDGGHGPARLAVVDPTEERLARARRVVERGEPWRGRGGIWFTPRGLVSEGGRTALLFPGVDAEFRPRVDDVARHFGLGLPEHLTPTNLEETGLGIVEVSRLCYQVLEWVGLQADAMAGHSIGEWTAMVCAGLVPAEAVDALLDELGPGSLEVPGVLFAAAGCGADQARTAMRGLPNLEVSADNCPHQVILCGEAASIQTVRQRLIEAGVVCQVLPFRSGFHSPLFREHLEPHRQHFARIPLERPAVPVWSATTCAPFPDDLDAVRELAVRHLVEPVRFRELIEALYQQGVRVFVQVGTGRLPGFVADTLGKRPHLVVSANDPRRSGLAQLRRMLAALYVEGAELDAAEVFPETSTSRPRTRLPLGAPLVQLDPSLALPRTAVPSLPESDDPVETEMRATLEHLGQMQEDVLRAWREYRGESRRGPRLERRMLSVRTVPSLIDHCFYPQHEGAALIDRDPVVPMTMIVETLLASAEASVPGKKAIALEELRLHKWLRVEPPVEVTLEATPLSGDRVRLRIEGYAEALVHLADTHPPAPEPRLAPPSQPRPPPLDARRLYGERWMFHGPDYQGVRSIEAVGSDGIEGELVVTDGPGALLDSAGQLFGFWLMATRDLDRLAMPTGLARLERFGPHPAPGEVLRCRVRITALTESELRGDLEVLAGDRVWCRIEGWSDHRFPSDLRVWPVLQRPERHLLSEPHGPFVLYDDTRSRPPSRDWLTRRYLDHTERRAMLEAGPRRQRAFLHGRIAAKDALRRLLWERGEGDCFPAEVPIRTAPDGRPRAEGRGTGLFLSLAHTGDVAVALASESGSVGIDVEMVGPRPRGFELAALADSETALLEKLAGADRDERLTRLFCAKEAAGKAEGAGLGFNPRRLVVSEASGERLRIGDRWVATRRIGDLVVAWTAP